MLVVFAGLPGTGKTTIARAVAHRLAAVFLRIDSIEQAIRECRGSIDVDGYLVAYAIAADNLAAGGTVIADCVNSVPVTRDAWHAVAAGAGVRVLDVEIICSDAAEHRRRVESRVADIPNHQLPTWREVVEREYAPWLDEHIVIDTAGETADASIAAALDAIAASESRA